VTDSAASTDLLALAAELVDIPSESHAEADLVADLEDRLRGVPWLELTRVGDNLVARTQLGRSTRLVLAGHTDTVPANGNLGARIDGDRLSGLGAADMKGGLAVMVELARTVDTPAVDVTYVFYAREEVSAAENGLLELVAERPDLLVGDVALLGEPTSANLEAGCQGTMRVQVTLVGRRAHTARPWMGSNAIHRAGEVLVAIAASEERQPVIDGCRFREALQAVAIEGGVAANVVPDRATITINHRFAPDRTPAEAEAHVRAVIGGHLEAGDEVEVVDVAVGATPATGHPLVQALVGRNGLAVDAKLGWTDVARFAELGLPAANFGPGDAAIAHTAGEFVTRDELEAVHRALEDLVRRGVDPAPAP
jgi:succinyl-diaminopimelate desuccinylase